METPTPPVVLIVDDEPSSRQFLAQTLTLGGYEVVEAPTGEHALRLMADGLEPDAVLLDLTMPGMGGLGFLLTLRAQPTERFIPVAIITAYQSIPHPVHIATNVLGAAVHLRPVSGECLLEITGRLLER